MSGTLHIYSPIWQHADGFILGDQKALEDLRDAIDRVLSGEEPTGFNASINDGEGYSVRVAMLSESDMSKLTVPYTDEMERSTRGVAPHQAIQDHLSGLVQPWDDPLS